jgi:creatinine amidohydrolase
VGGAARARARATPDGAARARALRIPSRSEMSTPQRLKELAPERIAAAIAVDPRLIVPIGTCDPHGPHLPLGCDTVLVERLADDLSAEFHVLRAPTVEYGVSADAARGHPRAGSVRKKTLHLLLNDLLASWERAGVREFILLTANGDDAHRDALATVVTVEARVRVIDVCSVDIGDFVTDHDSWRRGGAADTSLILYLAPHLVDMRLAQDYTPDQPKRRPDRWRWPRGAGRPGKASDEEGARAMEGANAAAGAALYDRIRHGIGRRIFVAPALTE